MLLLAFVACHPGACRASGGVVVAGTYIIGNPALCDAFVYVVCVCVVRSICPFRFPMSVKSFNFSRGSAPAAGWRRRPAAALAIAPVAAAVTALAVLAGGY